ncbi:MAG: type II toxin-antitoxin system RelE/ParE family toxin [Candidatus Roizmanbacteria bacterium]|nr:type II toxin-antitoxin system RelE/ParE family toxin [Candidatus Roizmanbacteria bacterium]
MKYSLRYHARALKRLRGIHPHDQKKVLKKLQLLSNNPFGTHLNIRKMANTPASYRLRIDNLRVIYEIDFEKQIIYVEDIDYRGSIY